MTESRASSADASTRTVVVAVVANLLVAAAKGAAAVLTGSAALAAETTHSVADTCNEVLLYIGVRRGAGPPDDRHPFGYGQARYYWSLLAAVGIFAVGGLFALADGVRSLRHPERVSNVPVGVAVLLVSAALEAWSWRTARRQLRDEAAQRNLDLTRHIVSSSDPSATTVFLEDSAALIGIFLALAALALDVITGSAVPDAVASLLIGLLLVAVAFLLMRRNGALLIDEAAPADVRARLRTLVAAESWVVEVAELTAVRVGPRQLVVLAHVVPLDGDDLAARITGLRRALLSLPAICRAEVTPVEPSRGGERGAGR
jgi:cation diffusion facilitator family transporter